MWTKSAMICHGLIEYKLSVDDPHYFVQFTEISSLLNQKFWNVDLLFDSNQRNLRSFTRKFKFLIIKLNLRTDFSYTLHKELSIFLMKTFCIFWFIQKIFDLKKNFNTWNQNKPNMISEDWKIAIIPHKHSQIQISCGPPSQILATII